MSLIRLVINSNGSADDFKSESPLAVGGHDAINNFTAYVTGVNGGEAPGALFSFNVGAVQAAGILTVSGAGSTAAQACTILNVTFTGVASAPAANEFVVGAAATQAANMIAAINASASFAGKVTAAAGTAGQVVITSVVPGTTGNGLQLSAGNLANVALTAFTGGSDGTAYSVNLR